MSDINEKSNFVFEFQPVTKLFEEQVRLHPDKCAVASSKESFTYAQLNERANRIANSLIEKGVGCEKIVGVVLERCCDFYAVRQGILKAGGAFAVAAPDYPDDRVQFIFEDAGAPFIITTKEIAKERQELFSRLSCKVLLLEELLENSNAGNPDTRIKEHDLCYCIYTSGSTGKPKGVMIEHINLANFVNPNPKNAETYGYVSRGSVSLSMAAMTFDVSVLEEFLPLTNGMTAVIASDEEILNPIMLGDLIVKNKVDIMTTTPTYLSNMIDLPQLQEAAAQIKVFDVGAEAFPPALFDKIHAVNPDAYIMNGYGPTETTISCTMKVITDSKNITIGEPNGNVQVYVVDKENRILPDGETGELVIAGLGVGRGYINLPEKTAEVFSTEKEPIKQAILQRSLQMARSNFSEELTIRSSFAVSESSLVRSRRLLTASKESSPVLQYRWIINIFAATLWQTARSMLKRLPLMRQNPWLITWFRMFSSSWKKCL